MTLSEAEQRNRIVHVLDHVADEHAIEPLTEIGVAGCVGAAKIEPFCVVVLAKLRVYLYRDGAARHLLDAPMLPFFL